MWPTPINIGLGALLLIALVDRFRSGRRADAGDRIGDETSAIMMVNRRPRLHVEHSAQTGATPCR
jgi:hypothetical protein